MEIYNHLSFPDAVRNSPTFGEKLKGTTSLAGAATKETNGSAKKRAKTKHKLNAMQRRLQAHNPEGECRST